MLLVQAMVWKLFKIDGDFGMHIKFWVMELKKVKLESHR